jgi:PIN domain nuclease of toxin-antitoxin system
LKLAFLLDTNIIVWFGFEDRRLSQKVVDLLLSGKEPLYISVVSAWEYEQKRKLRPDQFCLPFTDIVGSIPHTQLDLQFAISSYANSLPMIHRDPFDRMLVAQAILHHLEFVASDKAIHQYPVRTFW